MKKIEIGRSRIKTFFVLLGAVGFVVGGIWMLMASDTHLSEKIVVGIGLLFFGAAIPLGIKKLIKNETALELSKKYLIIEPKSSKKYVLPWDKITGFREVSIKGAKIILIKVRNPQDWINEEANTIKRKMMQFNFNNYGTPFCVTSSGLSISHKKLLELLNDFKINKEL
jgi:hypothetical protein